MSLFIKQYAFAGTRAALIHIRQLLYFLRFEIEDKMSSDFQRGGAQDI